MFRDHSTQPIDMYSTAVSDYCRANHGTITLAITWALLSIGIVVVSLRLYVRFGPRYRIGWDDYTAMASLVIGIITTGIITKIISSGLGKHTSCLPQEAYKYLEQLIIIWEGFNILGIGITKISMCLTLLRIVELARRRTTQFLWSLLIFVCITHSGLGMIYFIDSALGHPQSRIITRAGYIIWAVDAATDLICAGVPILVIRRLQMDMRAKLALCGLMSLGVLTAGCAVAKAVLLQRVTADDITWDLNIVAIWATIEQFLGIIITSIPMLRPLFSASHKSFHSWLRIRFSTQSHSSLRKNGSGSGSSPLVRSPPKQQIDGQDMYLRKVEQVTTLPRACHGHSRADRNNHRSDPIQLMVTEEYYVTENTPDDFEENRAVTAKHL